MTNRKGLGLLVHRIGQEQPVRFAANELARYLGQMGGRRVTVSSAKSYDAGRPGIWLGTTEHFKRLAPKGFAAPRDAFDDGIFIRAGNGHAVIAGLNPRSVLFAAYRFLEELGCRWFRPGPGGEYVPKVAAPLAKRIGVAEKPSARHRTICIEGSCSLGTLRNMLDYAPRRGFNSYFFQFRDCFPFLNVWYSRERYVEKEGKSLTLAQALAITRRAKQEALKRGLIIHSVGHGWTTAPFGIHPNQWGPGKKLSPSVRKYFAMINGKRGMYPRLQAVSYLPLITNLCYSNPKVRSIMAEEVAKYAASHREEQVIHVWLADGSNNNCECPQCRKARPSDFYVRILNEIDERLAEKRLSTRIVFLAYVDLLWAPEKSRIKNPDRFILMFAPITRSYTTAFLEKPPAAPEKVGPYVRNKLVFPRSPQANLKLLDGWRRSFDGECVDFDYHLWSRCNYDPTLLQVSRVLFKDLRDLRKLGMDGFISCQYQRIAFPTGFPLHVMGKTLWDRHANYDELIEDYFTDLFGRRGRDVLAYLEELARLFDPEFLRGEKPGDEALAKARSNWAKIRGHVDAFRPVIRQGLKAKEDFRKTAWTILEDHAWYSCAVADFLRQVAAKEDGAIDTLIAIEKELRQRRRRLIPVFDSYHAARFLRRRFTGRR